MRVLEQRVAEIASSIDGLFGVCVRELDSGQEVGLRLDEPLPMASTCKIPILAAAYRANEAGALDLKERIEFTAERRCFGSGLFNAFEPGLQPTFYDLLLMMIVVSDNAATDIVLQRLTPARVTATMRDLGLRSIRIDRDIAGLIGDILGALDPRCAGVKFAEWDDFLEAHPDIKAREEDLAEARRAVNEAAADRDVATVRDLARLCAQIALKECATHESCDAMIEILNKQQLNTRLPRDLPAFVKFPHKTGTLGSGAVVNDAGILYIDEEPKAAVAVLSRDVRNPIHETSSAMAAIGRAVHDYYDARSRKDGK